MARYKGKPIMHGDVEFASLKEMAKFNNVSSSAICNRMRDNGRYKGKAIYYIPQGNSVMARLSPDHYQWLVEQSPDGSSVDEILAAIITDAMNDD